jgi:hypothetical protein
MLDAEDVPDLAFAVGEMAKAAAALPVNAAADMSETDYRVGSVRVGFVRLKQDVVAFMQVGDIALIAQKAVWQVPSTLFLAPRELQALAAALNEATAKVRSLRKT